MGSSSDLGVMQEAIQVCKDFGVAYEVDIVSAHRTPVKMMTYAQQAKSRGIQVIIAGAGGAAAGVLAGPGRVQGPASRGGAAAGGPSVCRPGADRRGGGQLAGQRRQGLPTRRAHSRALGRALRPVGGG